MNSQRRAFLITASSGIGATTAKQLASEATAFYLAGTGAEAGHVLASELRGCGSEAEFHEADLTDPDAASAIVAACGKRFGRIDALFNVAGASGRPFGDGPVHECTEPGWQMTLDLNATTQYRMCREVVNRMLCQEIDGAGLRGTILNMSSILALHPDARHFNNIAYVASKGAVLAMTRAMAACYASQHIRVNAVAPGLVRTAMSARATDDPEILEYMHRRQPLLSNAIEADDVAAVCAHLLSDTSKAMTGQVIQIDGGWSIA